MEAKYTIHPNAEKMLSEPGFRVFKHNGLLCCVQRINWSGNLNGYVAVDEKHPLYEKHYSSHVAVADKKEVAFNGNYLGLLCHAFSPESDSDLISLDLVINVHGGLTFSRIGLNVFDENVFGKLWWFGFDTAHAGDLRPIENDIDRRYRIHEDNYRDFDYVLEQTKSLADQLAAYSVA